VAVFVATVVDVIVGSVTMTVELDDAAVV